jgi:hypothetical protein
VAYKVHQGGISSLSNHEHYEQICALVAVGDTDEVPEADLLEWNEHRRGCDECRQVVPDIRTIGLVLLSVTDVDSSPPPGMMERFIARAEREGIRFGNRNSKRTRSKRVVLWAATVTAAFVVVLVMAALLGQRIAVLLGQRSEVLEERSRHALNSSPVQASNTSANGLALPETQSLQNELRQAHVRQEELRQTLASRQKMLDGMQQEEGLLKSRISELEQESGNAIQTNAQLQQQVERLQSEREANRNASLTEEAELASLRAKVNALTEQLSEERRLDRATKLVRNLIGARNLHVITSHDNNESGGQEKPFGRILYKENQLLVFYAYDLPEAGAREKHFSFYVWGEKSSTKESVANLGLLRSDDHQDARWILSIDDPNVLTHIDSVFVTAETNNRPVVKPTGRKLLSTRLDVRPTQP